MDDWLSLSKAAKIFGVHPSTLRVWADKGLLPVHRTKGGHRRFLRSEIDLWSKSRIDSADESARVIQSALRHTRIQLSDGLLENEAWYAMLNDAARLAYRRSGREIMRGLSVFLASDKLAAQTEAQALGHQYALLGRRHELTITDATRAFLFFRRILQEAMLSAYEGAEIQSPQAWASMSRKISRFADEVLLALMSTYDSLKVEDGA
jgi:excisionase family DNA binding protein